MSFRTGVCRGHPLGCRGETCRRSSLCQVFCVITRQTSIHGLFWGMTNWIARLVGETQVRMLGLLRRSRQSITGLAEALGLTDNAVRMHVAALHRHGIVEQVGTLRETGGKPARLYGLTPEGEELFPKAYALVLGKLVEEIVRTHGRARAVELLRAVGAQAATAAPRGANSKRRMEAAAQAFR